MRYCPEKREAPPARIIAGQSGTTAIAENCVELKLVRNTEDHLKIVLTRHCSIGSRLGILNPVPDNRYLEIEILDEIK